MLLSFLSHLLKAIMDRPHSKILQVQMRNELHVCIKNLFPPGSCKISKHKFVFYKADSLKTKMAINSRVFLLDRYRVSHKRQIAEILKNGIFTLFYLAYHQEYF